MKLEFIKNELTKKYFYNIENNSNYKINKNNN